MLGASGRGSGCDRGRDAGYRLDRCGRRGRLDNVVQFSELSFQWYGEKIYVVSAYYYQTLVKYSILFTNVKVFGVVTV